MAEMIQTAAIIAQGPPVTQRATPETGAAGTEPVKPGGNQDAAFRRIAQQAQSAKQEALELRERLARVEGQLLGQPKAPSTPSVPNTWAELSDAQLDQAINVGMTDSNSAAVTASINEKVARAARQAAESAKGVSTKEYEQAKLHDSIQSEIATTFGPAANDQDSPLFLAADRHYATLVSRYGKNQVNSNPEFIKYAFTMADRELHAGETQKLHEVQQENERLKRQMQLEHGGVHPGVPRSQESADALAKGDLKGAIAGSALFKSVASDVKRRYGP